MEVLNIIGIDLGATNLRIGLLQGTELIYQSILSSRILTAAENSVAALGDVIESFLNESGQKEIGAIGIGVPSSVAKDGRTVICTTNLPGPDGRPVFENADPATPLSERFGVPVYLKNDTDFLLYRDIIQFHLEDKSCVLGIYIGTGVGAALCCGGEFFDGAHGAALDIGHIPFFQGSEACNCGKEGCCECYASGWKLMKIRDEFFPGEEIGDLFVKYADSEVLKEFVSACAHIFAVMITIFDPDAVVAGGGVLEMKGFPREEFERRIEETTGRDVMQFGRRICYSQSNESGGIFGAACYALKQEGSFQKKEGKHGRRKGGGGIT